MRSLLGASRASWREGRALCLLLWGGGPLPCFQALGYVCSQGLLQASRLSCPWCPEDSVAWKWCPKEPMVMTQAAHTHAADPHEPLPALDLDSGWDFGT